MEVDHSVVARYSPDPGPYIDMWRDREPSWLSELEPTIGPPYNKMGTHALRLDDWFQVDQMRDPEVALRRQLFDERPDDVYAMLPWAEDAAQEVFDLLTEWMSVRGLMPAAGVDGDLPPLAAAGMLVQDDLCLMNFQDGQWRLGGAILCFPSVWRLQDKIGQTTAAIHGPVGHYADELEPRVDRFFDRMRVESPVWRRNLTLKPTNALFLPISKAGSTMQLVSVAEDGSPYWLRTERQTLRKLPRSGAILFTIRTQLAPMGVLRRRPDVARAILGMCESWDDEMRAFKMADSNIAASLVPWLRSIAGPSAP
jgi:hypothetical protein